MLAAYVSLSIYQTIFWKVCRIQKQQKILRNCWCLANRTPTVCFLFYKLIFFETLIIFLGYTIEKIA